MVRPSSRRTAPCTVSWIHGDAVPKQVPGRTAARSCTVPDRPSMRRASSDHGSRPATPVLSASVTRTLPDAVRNVVVSTLVPGTYSRSVVNSSTGRSSMQPPWSASSRAANTGGASIAGSGSQSMLPSRATSARVRPSPIAA